MGVLAIRCALALLLACAAGASAVPGRNLIANGDFAADSDGDGMADYWHFSGDEGVKVTWSRGEGLAGRQAQSLTCTSFVDSGPASHAMLAQDDTFALEEGHWYRISFNAKGDLPGRAASVAIQQTGPWEMLGLHAMFRVLPEWKHHSFAFRARKSVDKNLRLQIWFTEPGTLWLDDVQLVEGEVEEAEMKGFSEVVPDVGSKNLVPNSSFECGVSGWGSAGTTVGWSGGLSTLFGRIDHQTAAQHGSSFRIDLDRATAPALAFDYFEAVHKPVLFVLTANRGWISVEPGKPYTLSAYMKSDPPGAPCVLGVQEAFGPLRRHDFAGSANWQRVSFTFTPDADQVYVGAGADLTRSDLPKATVWIDGVQLERGPEMTEYELRTPVEVGLEWERPGHLFASPGEARAIVTAFNGGRREAAVRISALVKDFFDRKASEPGLSLSLGPGQGARRPLPLGVSQKGYYSVRLQADGASVVPINAERCGVIDLCRDRAGLFGMNHAYPSQELLRLSRDIGLTWFRDWSLKWQQVEPEKGRFTFEETDFQIDRVLNEGLNVLGLLPFPSSEWASSAPPDEPPSPSMGEHARQAHRPRDLAEFAEYVRTTVKHYRGRIKVWEILNEPLYTGYALPEQSGYGVPDYVAVLRTAYEAIKEVDPGAFVVGGVAGDPTLHLHELIEAGALRWLDAINIHIYPVFRAPESYIASLDELNAALERSGTPKPVYFTEGAYYADDDLAFEPYRGGDNLLQPLESELDCSSYQVRFDAILLAHNVRSIIYHSGTPGHHNQASVDGIFFEWDGAPRKMAVSQSVLTGLLGPDTEYVGAVWERPRSLAFHSRGRTVVVLWDEQAGGSRLTPRPGAQVIDISGAPVTEKTLPVAETPYYLVIPGELTLPQLQRALSGWRG